MYIHMNIHIISVCIYVLSLYWTRVSDKSIFIYIYIYIYTCIHILYPRVYMYWICIQHAFHINLYSYIYIYMYIHIISACIYVLNLYSTRISYKSIFIYIYTCIYILYPRAHTKWICIQRAFHYSDHLMYTYISAHGYTSNMSPANSKWTRDPMQRNETNNSNQNWSISTRFFDRNWVNTLYY